jgi:tRNA (mo5U34)-methyltransferase
VFDRESAIRLIAGRPWHHDFEIIPGVRTGGAYDPGALWAELDLPANLSGLRLADVGASNGFFSFEARKRGAEVVAFDIRHKDNSGFGLLQHINGMTDITHCHANVLDVTPELYGRFDVVLALGLLYHVSDPYLALSRCAGLARRRLFIESHCIDTTGAPEADGDPIMRFFADPTRFPDYGHLNGDRSNFWGFTSECLRRMVEDVGFAVRRLRVSDGPLRRVLIDAERHQVDRSATRLGLAYSTVPAIRAGDDRNEPSSWTIF